MAAATETATPFIITKIRPPMVSAGKTTQQLGTVGKLDMGVQVVAPNDGDTNLHAHPGLDTAWVVIDGQAEFYSTGDEVVATLNKNETIMIPAGAPYWFKASSSTPLVILHVVCIGENYKRSSRIDYKPRNDQPHNALTGTFYES